MAALKSFTYQPPGTRTSANFRYCFILLLLFQVVQLPVTAQGVNYSSDIKQKITEVENKLKLWVHVEGLSNRYSLKERMAFYKVNGVSIAVIKDYKVEWAKGYGWADSAEQKPVTTATLFQAASISKSLNGVGVLKLVQDGKLNLSSDINEYLRSWKFPYDSLSKGKKITTSNLLSHTAGLSISGFPGYQIDSTLPSRQQILDGIAPANTKAVRSAFEPGLKYQYSGGGTTISQTIVEDITGKAYDTYMWENVLKPLGMNNSTFALLTDKKKAALRATAYQNDGRPVNGKYHLYPEQAAAALWTNPIDLSKFIIETQRALQGRSNKVLSQEMTKLQLTPFIDTSVALGVMISKRGSQSYFGHSGSNAGFKSQYIGSLDGGNGVVVMVNSDNGSIITEIINSVATVYNWDGFYVPKVRKTILVESSLLNSYVGNYNINTQTVAILREADKLVLIQGGIKSIVYFTSDTDFFTTEVPNGEFSFVMDSNNKVEALQLKRGSNVIKLTKVL
jgi:CubicO group peptidase (beta-lactamase class C family)